MENVKVLSTSNKLLALEMQNKEITPSKETQIISADEGYIGLDTVTISAVTSDIDSNITPENIKKDVSVLGVVGIFEGYENPQEKTVTPSNERQEITPDEGYTCLSKVIVEGITTSMEISTEAEMDALLINDNIGKIYKFVGTSSKYITNAIYIVEEN